MYIIEKTEESARWAKRLSEVLNRQPPAAEADIQVSDVMIIIIIIMDILMCYFSREHIALTQKKNGVRIESGKTNGLNALCMMQNNISNKQTVSITQDKA